MVWPRGSWPVPRWPSTGPGTGLGRLALRKRVGNLVVLVVARVVRVGSFVIRVVAGVVNRVWEVLKTENRMLLGP